MFQLSIKQQQQIKYYNNDIINNSKSNNNPIILNNNNLYITKDVNLLLNLSNKNNYNYKTIKWFKYFY